MVSVACRANTLIFSNDESLSDSIRGIAPLVRCMSLISRSGAFSASSYWLRRAPTSVAPNNFLDE